MNSRQCIESPVRQGVDEEIYYTLTVPTTWGTSPASVSVVAKNITSSTWSDVSATVLSGSSSVNGQIITLPKVKSLTAENRYRIEIKFTVNGNVLEAFFEIIAEI